MQNIQDLMRSSEAVFVDVRSEMEFDMEHIKGAKNIPLEEVLSRKDEIDSLGRPLIFYCRSGNRSGMAVSLLKQAGLNDIYNGGGIDIVKMILS